MIFFNKTMGIMAATTIIAYAGTVQAQNSANGSQDIQPQLKELYKVSYSSDTLKACKRKERKKVKHQLDDDVILNNHSCVNGTCEFYKESKSVQTNEYYFLAKDASDKCALNKVANSDLKKESFYLAEINMTADYINKNNIDMQQISSRDTKAGGYIESNGIINGSANLTIRYPSKVKNDVVTISGVEIPLSY